MNIINKNNKLDYFQESYFNYLKNKRTNNVKKTSNRIISLINIGKKYLEIGEIEKGITSYDKALELNFKKFDSKNENTKKILNEYILNLNKVMIYNLNLKKFDNCLIILKKCENLFLKFHYKNKNILTLTYNNFSLFYKQQGNLNFALKYSNKAKLNSFKNNNVYDTLLITLNSCSILSRMKKYFN